MSIFKKSIAYIGLLFFALGIVIAPGSVSAQTGDLFSGQDHSYSVIFRGNGEAVVYGKIDFTNTGEEPVKKFSLEIPSVKPGELMFLQTVDSPDVPFECPGYPAITQREFCPNINYYGYVKPDYSTPEYKKLKFTTTGTLHEMELAQEITANQKGNIVFAYVASGYAKKSLGVYKFEFETPKVASRIKTMNVTVDVDSDLVLKGKRAEVNYATSGMSNMMADMPTGARADSFVSSEFSQVVSTIGLGGPVTKSAQNLAPNESLTVNGEYAESGLALNGIKIAGLLLAGIIIVIALVFLFRYWKKHTAVAVQSTQTITAPVNETFKLIHPMYTSIGFVSGAVIYGAIYLAQIFIRTTLMYGGYSSGITYLPLTIVFFVGITILAVLIIPPVLVGSKYGWRAGISVVVNTFLTLILFLAIYVLLNVTGIWPSSRVNQPYYGGPYMM